MQWSSRNNEVFVIFCTTELAPLLLFMQQYLLVLVMDFNYRFLYTQYIPTLHHLNVLQSLCKQKNLCLTNCRSLIIFVIIITHLLSSIYDARNSTSLSLSSSDFHLLQSVSSIFCYQINFSFCNGTLSVSLCLEYFPARH